jgi:hypothetical protein
VGCIVITWYSLRILFKPLSVSRSSVILPPFFMDTKKLPEVLSHIAIHLCSLRTGQSFTLVEKNIAFSPAVGTLSYVYVVDEVSKEATRYKFRISRQ